MRLFPRVRISTLAFWAAAAWLVSCAGEKASVPPPDAGTAAQLLQPPAVLFATPAHAQHLQALVGYKPAAFRGVRITLTPRAGADAAYQWLQRLPPGLREELMAQWAAGRAIRADLSLDNLQAFEAAGEGPFQVTLEAPLITRQVMAPRNRNAADTSNIDDIQPGGSSGYNLTGLGVYLGIWDESKVRTSHVDFQGRARIMDSASFFSFHATHVGGTMAGAGVGAAAARGMSYEAQLWSFDWNTDRAEINDFAGGRGFGYGLTASNHSYGPISGWYFDATGSFCAINTWTWWGTGSETEDRKFGRYRTDERDLDQAIVDTGLLSIWAAGNERTDEGPSAGTPWYDILNTGCGSTKTESRSNEKALQYDIISGGGVAKNTIAIAALEDITADPINPANIAATEFSSYGPADDSRIKPDLGANGRNLFSTSNTSDTAYDTAQGTSMASPTVTGGVGLLAQLYRQKNFHDARAHEMKAILIHTALDAGGPGPDAAVGWGLFDAKAAADLIQADSQLAIGAKRIRHGIAQSGQTVEYDTPSIAAGTPLRFTMVWTDPAGTANTGPFDDPAPALVNDLDLEAVPPGGGGPFFPWSLSAATPASAAANSGPNRRDNVERVDVSAAQNTFTGAWKLRVTVNPARHNGQAQAFAIASTHGLSGGGTPKILGAQKVFEFSATAGQSSVPSQTLTLYSLSGNLFPVTIASNQSWLSVSPVSFNAPGSTAISVNASSLSIGVARGVLTILGADGGQLAVGVNVRVVPGPENCANGTDDDGDGFADCKDADCNNKTCSDGNGCTQSDVCSGGSCVGSNPVICAPAAACKEDGVCQPATGACTHADKSNGTLCDDGLYCTANDSCQAGSCTGTARSCSGPCATGTCNEAMDRCDSTPKPNGDPCDDGLYCTTNETCQNGVCGGAARDCSSVADQCNTAQCNETSDACEKVPKTNGTTCEDGQYCTVNDFCSGGLCRSGVARSCGPAGDQCNTWSCNETADRCDAAPKSNGTLCDDGLYCTGDDKCENGACKPGPARDCSGLNGACTAGACNEAKDACEAAPKAAGTACDDGVFCTVNDACKTDGSCGGSPRDCSIFSNVCGDGVCNESARSCETRPKADGAACDDGKFCTTGDFCERGECKGAPRDCSAFSTACSDGACNESAKACASTPKPNGTICDDGKFCTDGDLCQGGLCVGGAPRQCSGASSCRESACDEASKKCALKNRPAGTPCGRAGKCANDILQPGDACNENGDCAPRPQVSCSPFVCGGPAECANQCVKNSECAPGFVCKAQVCRANQKPVAALRIDPPQAQSGSRVTLDGSGSSDPDGDPITLIFRVLEGPEVVFEKSGSTGASFAVPPVSRPTPLNLSMVAADGFTVSAPATGTVMLLPPNAPASDAGPPPDRDDFDGSLTGGDGSSATSVGGMDPDGGAGDGAAASAADGAIPGDGGAAPPVPGLDGGSIADAGGAGPAKPACNCSAGPVRSGAAAAWWMALLILPALAARRRKTAVS